jgi:hypothetical protein
MSKVLLALVIQECGQISNADRQVDDENRLQRKINGLSIETRPLPGEKGQFLARRDVLDLERMVKGSPSEIIKNGKAIMTCYGSSAVVDQWVKRVAHATNTDLDWMYRAGRVIVYHLGDGRQQAINELQKPETGISNVALLSASDLT